MINVIGLGYIGLPTALILAACGNKVIGTDKNKQVVANLVENKALFEENGIEKLYETAVKNQITFTTKYMKTDFYIIAVPTPYLKKNKKIDSTYVVDAVQHVLEVCEDNSILVIESTISPGTIDREIRPMVELYETKEKKRIYLAHAPERIIPGNMLHELENNSRTIGTDSLEIGKKVKHVYESFCKGEIVLTDIRTAEMTKVVENTFRDINIAFANELAKICRSDNMNVYEIIRIANKHPRVNILNPGPGVGGHCISVDPWFLVGDYPGLSNIILAARKINDSMPEFVLKRISDLVKKYHLSAEKIGLYGLTYKEDVDDIRESPTLQLIECMEKHLGGELKVFDPHVKSTIVEKQYFDFQQFINEIDLIVIMVGHSHLKEHLEQLNGKIVLDTRHILSNQYGEKYETL